ncbi:hypothetical protein HZB90_00510 [archaeon]|nr:hypothetical protein [archaeon]
MAIAVVTMKIMPESPEVDLQKVQDEVTKLVLEFAGKGDTRITIEPIAFGLKCNYWNFIYYLRKNIHSCG